jgi:hypothetical protein
MPKLIVTMFTIQNVANGQTKNEIQKTESLIANGQWVVVKVIPFLLPFSGS